MKIKTLLIVGTKVIHNTLIYWIEYQAESVRTTFQGSSQEFKAKNGFKIVSNCLPCLSKDGTATIKGKYRDHDLDVDKVELKTHSEAKDLENRVQEAVKEFNEAGGFEKPLPEIELKGVDPKWKYCAKDESENIFVYDVRPTVLGNLWRTVAVSFESVRTLKQTQFEEMKKLPWEESLHKIKHI